MSAGQREALSIVVRLLGDRWHGEGDWPPSPFRLFQALVAGAYGGRWRSEGDRAASDRAFSWLEQLGPPLILAPRGRPAARVQYFVPNNDLDSVDNDPRRSAEIRTAKVLRSFLIDGDEPFVFIWEFDSGSDLAELIASLCERLHTFGRGLDGAFATATISDVASAQAFAEGYRGIVARSSLTAGNSGGLLLQCPEPGSLQSLHKRFAATQQRFTQTGTARRPTIEFRQPPKASMRLVSYERPSRYLTFEFREISDSDAWYPIRLSHSSPAAKAVRNLASDRLSSYLDRKLVERFVVGRGIVGEESRQRMRFLPLPSIGNAFTDPSIRRIVIELPPECPISEVDVNWALSGQALEALGSIRLVEAGSTSMAYYQYGIRRSSSRWQTVTPAVLPTARTNGRIGARIRLEAERSVSLEVVQALRHAGIRAHPRDIRIQREPFLERGLGASSFEADRFDGERLYHVEISFDEEVPGILAIGDGRWLGLGLMRPLRTKSIVRHDEESALPDYADEETAVED